MKGATGLKLLQAYDGYQIAQAKSPKYGQTIGAANKRIPGLAGAYATVKGMRMTIPAFIAKYGTISAIKQNRVTAQELEQIIEIITGLGDNTYASQLRKLQGQMAQEGRGAADAVAQVATFEGQERQRTQAQVARDEQLARELQQREQEELLARQAQQKQETPARKEQARKAAMVSPAPTPVVRQQPMPVAAPAAAPARNVSFAEPVVQEQPAAVPAPMPARVEQLEEEVLELAQVAKQAAQVAQVAARDAVVLEAAVEDDADGFGDFVSAEAAPAKAVVAPSVAEQSEVTGFMGRLGLKIQELKKALESAISPRPLSESEKSNGLTEDWGPDNGRWFDQYPGAADIGNPLVPIKGAYGSATDRAMNLWNGEKQSSEPITYSSRDETDSEAEARAMMAPYDAEEAARIVEYEQEGAVAAAQNKRAIDAEQRVKELDQLVNGPKGFADMRPVSLRVQQAAELRNARQELAAAEAELGIQDEPVLAAQAKKSSGEKLREGLRSEFGVGQRTAAQQANDARAAAEWQQALDDEAQLAADRALVRAANEQGRKTFGTAPRWVNPRSWVDQAEPKDTRYLQEGRDAEAREIGIAGQYAAEDAALDTQLDQQVSFQDEADAQFSARSEKEGRNAELDELLLEQEDLQDQADAQTRAAYEKEGAEAAAAEEARERGFFRNLGHNVSGLFGKGSSSDSSGEVSSEPVAQKQSWYDYLAPWGEGKKPLESSEEGFSSDEPEAHGSRGYEYEQFVDGYASAE